jgi:hypothetical protein
MSWFSVIISWIEYFKQESRLKKKVKKFNV